MTVATLDTATTARSAVAHVAHGRLTRRTSVISSENKRSALGPLLELGWCFDSRGPSGYTGALVPTSGSANQKLPWGGSYLYPGEAKIHALAAHGLSLSLMLISLDLSHL